MDLVAETAADHGLEVLRTRLTAGRGRGRLLVTVDLPGGSVGVDALGRFSEDLSRRLDRLDPLEGPYVLECESPGPHRPLRLPRDVPRFQGAQVSVRLRQAGRRRVRGRLVGGDAQGLDLAVGPEGAPLHLALEEIDEALLDEGPSSAPAGRRRKGRGT